MAKRRNGGKTRTSEPAQLPLWKQRGGKRRGAGRPPKGARAGSPHKTRPPLNPRHPVHVTLRAVAAVGNLRKRDAAPFRSWAVDWFSSGGQFPDWAEYGDAEAFLWERPSPAYEPLLVWRPRTWLLAHAWKLTGPISCRDVPGSKR
jgi:hypothetical protein